MSGEVRITRESAQDDMRAAGQAWNSAMRGMRSYPERLRFLAAAAEQQRQALTRATVVEVPWSPRPGARKLRTPHDLSAGHRPDAPPALWARFDRTLTNLGRLLEGDSSLAVANGFAELALVLDDLATALEPADGARRTQAGG